MRNQLPYNRMEHGDFFENWQPHHNADDIWEWQGILHESLLPQAMYAFHLSIYKIERPFESFFAIQYSLGNVQKAQEHTERVVIPILPGKTPQIDFDRESVFCGEQVQFLDTQHAFVLRLRGTEFGLDLRLDKKNAPVWFGDSGMIQLDGSKRGQTMFSGYSTHMDTFGRLYLGDQDLRVEGSTCMERMWGTFPIKNARLHWEKFFLFFDDQTELALINVPLVERREGVVFERNGESHAIPYFVLEPVEFLEIEEWRFSSLWKLDLPSMNRGPYYLIPLIKTQFRLPVSRPMVGIFDKAGKQYGFGQGELFPGARNELDRVKLRMFKSVVQK